MTDYKTGKEKLKGICDIIQNETLTPAKKEAEKIIANAYEKAHTILCEAEEKEKKLLEEAHQKIEQEKTLFESSLRQASKKVIEGLRQEIEQRLFNEELYSWVQKNTADPQVCAQLITALVSAIEKEGISADFSVLIPAAISPEKINALLAAEMIEKMREKTVVVSSLLGGIQVKLHDHKLTLDLSDTAVTELLMEYLRKDFCKLLFKS